MNTSGTQYLGYGFSLLLLAYLATRFIPQGDSWSQKQQQASVLRKSGEIREVEAYRPLGSISEENYRNLYSGNVKVFRLEEGGDDIGYSVWLKRSGGKVRAKYFACGEVNKRFNEWKSGRNIVLTCSGAFTTNDFGNPLPVGLTIDNGLVVNKHIHEEMDGLVLVYGTGGIAVSDKDEGNLYLKSIGKRVDIRETWDKYELIKWAEEEEATIFQTQLLAYKNDLRLEVHKARKKNRERRILVLARDSGRSIYHIIFDVRDGVYLGDISQRLLTYLKSKSVEVVAMLNLDTGWYNMFKLYDQNRELVLKRNPDKDPTNLLVYYYE